MAQKFDWHEIEQLVMDLKVEEIEGDKNAPSYAEVQARSETARQVLEAGGLWPGKEEDKIPQWFGYYLKLRQIGFSWRVSTYIAWAASPKIGRWPETQAELAEKVLGLTSPRQITEWRKKDPRIDDAITMMQAAPLHEHRADIYNALVAVATDPDYKGHSDRKLALELLGDYIPRSRMDLGKASDEDGAKSLSDAELRKHAGDLYETIEAEEESAEESDEE